MNIVQVDVPIELLQAAGIQAHEAPKLLALGLFREGAVSLGGAAELCKVSQAEFMRFADEREVPLHYTLEDLEQDRQLIRDLM